MKKRLLFYYRYLTVSRHFRLWRARWLTVQTFFVLGIILAFWGTMAYSSPMAGAAVAAGRDKAAGGQMNMAGVQNNLAGAGETMNSGAVFQELAQPEQEELALVQEATVTPEPNLPPTRTPLPEEYISNSNETVGITLASVVLVLIVIVGVLLLMPHHDER